MIVLQITALLLAALHGAPSQDVDVAAPPIAPAVNAEPTEMRVHDLRILTGHESIEELIAGLQESTHRDEVADAFERMQQVEDVREHVARTTTNLVDSLRDMMAPSLDTSQHSLVHIGSGRIALVGTAAQHTWLESFRQAAAEFDGMIDVQARIFVMERGKLGAYTPVGSGSVLDPEEATGLLKDLTEAGAEQIVAPRLMTFPFQEATLAVINQEAYIKDYELKVFPDLDAEIVDPVIGVVEDGMTMSLRAMPMAEGYLGIQAHLEYAVLERPIPTVDLHIGSGGHPVTVQVPHVTRISIEGRFHMKPGHSLLLFTSDPPGINDVVVVLNASVISMEELVQDPEVVEQEEPEKGR